ncbi:MAG TPA: ABC transporter substrate-binding protein [Steroidobacteraceae bacterium]|jgi:phospholipid transport system substrate-binding protein|nr:ABC transporter substrate-binding protein [Steroidobacteraceae bacterium]
MRNAKFALVAALSLGALGALAVLPANAAQSSPAPATGTGGNLGAGVDSSAPAKLVQTAASAMLKELDAHRADYRANPGKVHGLVDQVLLPHFDTTYSARLVLGRHWRDANDDQRKRFVDAFYRSLLNNYGDALVDFTADKLQVLPYNGDPKADNATVKTKVRKSDGSSVEVDYALHKTDDGWKAWDVIIEGISYVRSFREDFDSEIEQKGIDEVITRLQSGETPQAIKHTTTTLKKS